MSGNQLQTRNERQTLRSLSVCERMHYGVSVQWMKKNPCLSELYANYSPSYWPHLSRIGDGAYTRVCPALGALDDLYATRGAAATWVQAQVTAMYVASGSRDATMANAITVFSENFSNVAAAYKLTELMLFFSRYAAGMYDDSYTTFSARRIGVAFHKEFLPQRDQVIAKIERENGARKMTIPAFAIKRQAYDAASDFSFSLRILRDSEELRKELCVSGMGVNGIAEGVLPKSEVWRVHDYVKRGDVRIIKISAITRLSGSLSEDNSEDDRLPISEKENSSEGKNSNEDKK